MSKLTLPPAGAAAPPKVSTGDRGGLGDVPSATVARAAERDADGRGARGHSVPKLAGVSTAASTPLEVKAGRVLDHPWLAARGVVPGGLLPGQSLGAGWGH